MTSRLAHLRSQLTRLARSRQRLRAAAAWSAIGSSILIALACLLALDLVFDLAAPQRVVVLLLAIAAISWCYWRLARPLLGRREGEVEMALLVERQQQIDSDLVAALQFESPEARGWGSPQLAAAVVDHVSAAGANIDVFQGLSREQAARRIGLFAACFAIALVSGACWPGHLTAFLNRLSFGSQHYPTRTRIEQVVVNRTAVLTEESRRALPSDCPAAQGRPLTFVVQCGGQLPPSGAVHLTASKTGGGRTRVDLKPLSPEQRLTRLREARAKLSDAIANSGGSLDAPWRDEVVFLMRFDAPAAVPPLVAARQASELPGALQALNVAIAGWPSQQRKALLAGELARLNDDVSYTIAAGDAWTDAASIRMIPLPIVELAIEPVAPAYAATKAPQADASGRQLAVLEGSSVKMMARSTKPLTAAWLALQKASGPARIELESRDQGAVEWSPRNGDSPLVRLREEVRYELQVIDADGLSLETPIRGTIRIRPDQPPTGVAEVIHKVVLPAAEPVVGYRASDDYGVSRLALVVDVERGGAKVNNAAISGETDRAAGNADSTTGIASAPAAAHAESHRYEILAPSEPLRGEQLPVAGRYALALSPLKLAKGDRLKLTLEVTDYRGENEGRPIGAAQRSEPLVLEISDESGVLAAISQADQRSADQLSEIIKRQLGIGEER